MPENEENKAENQVVENPTGPQVPGIVLTGVEQFDGQQGFVSAEQAQAAGLSVTGRQAGVEAEPQAEKAPAKKAAKKGAKKGAK